MSDTVSPPSTADRASHATTAVRPAGSRRYRLDAFRAIAAMSVVTFHAYQANRVPPRWEWPLQGTFLHEVMLATDLFVDLFFVVSGFLLTLPYLRAALGDGAPRGARIFLLKRVARLVPAYYAVVLLVWSVTNPALPGHWEDLLLHLTFTQVYSEDYIFWTDGPTWTLAIEIHFALLIAVLGALAQTACRRLPRGGRVAVLVAGTGGLVLAGVAYKAWAVYVLRAPETSWPVWFGPLAKLDVFAMGIVLALVAACGIELHRRSARALTIAGGFALVAGGLVLREEIEVPPAFVHTIFAAGSALVIGGFATLTPAGHPGARWLRWRFLLFVGLISYSLYLWHEPLLRFIGFVGLRPERDSALAFPVTAILVLGLGIPLAWCSYRVLEQTGMKILAAFDANGRPRDYYADAEVSRAR
ncbi:acyltransferase [Saccharopolyspora taberi]|uniref:Acyltransferase n=1 Tax=Saccharopolyspora taberi TaxID=60895 RepID=A0ABN3VN69_9PSEU